MTDNRSVDSKTPKTLRTSKGDNWIKQWFSSITPLFEIGSSIKGTNFGSEFFSLKSSSLWYGKTLLPH